MALRIHSRFSIFVIFARPRSSLYSLSLQHLEARRIRHLCITSWLFVFIISATPRGPWYSSFLKHLEVLSIRHLCNFSYLFVFVISATARGYSYLSSLLHFVAFCIRLLCNCSMLSYSSSQQHLVDLRILRFCYCYWLFVFIISAKNSFWDWVRPVFTIIFIINLCIFWFSSGKQWFKRLLSDSVSFHSSSSER